MSTSVSTAELRHALAEDIRGGRVRWIRLDGVSAAQPTIHRGLQVALRFTGVSGEIGIPRPECVVLDWTHLEALTADGVAFAVVLIQSLREQGIAVVCCPPQLPNVAAALAHPSCHALRGEGVDWIFGLTGRIKELDPRALGSMHIFAGAQGFSVARAIDEIEQALQSESWSVPSLLGALIMETAQNVYTHANASSAAIGAVLAPRRRPARLQIGVADNGVGIPRSILNDPRHGWLESFSPARATETVVRQQLSGRGAGDTGGVLGELYGTLVADAGATVTLRSGGGWVRIGGKSNARHESFTHGFGTQLLVEIPLVGR